LAIASALLSFVLRPKQPKSQRSSAPSADYGISIPRILGKMKVPGNLVLAVYPKMVSQSGKGGLFGGGNKGDKFFGTCQVLVGEGNLHGIHGSTTQSTVLPDFLYLSNTRLKNVQKVGTINQVNVTYQQSTNTFNAGVGFVNAVFTYPDFPVIQKLTANVSGNITVTKLSGNNGDDWRIHSFVQQGNTLFITSTVSVVNPQASISSAYNAFGASPQPFDVTDFSNWVPSPSSVINHTLPAKMGFIVAGNNSTNTTWKINAIRLYETESTVVDGRLYLKKIYINDKIWYNKDDINTLGKSQYFEFYRGDPIQTKSPTLSAILGASKTPEYSGISYCVFKDLPLHDFGSDNYPTFHFEVDSLHSVTPYLLIKDLLYRCGVYFNRQLTENNHYITTTAIRAISALSNILGFQIDQQGSTPRDYVDHVTQLYDVSYYQTNQLSGSNGLTSLLVEKNYDFSAGVSSDTGVVIDLERKELNSSQDRQSVPVYEISSDSRKIASSVEVKALNVNNNYENIAITLNQFVGDSNGEIATVSFSLATDSADLLRVLAQRALVKSSHGSIEITHTDSNYLRNVQDVLNVQGSNLPLLRTKRIGIGANGVVQTERYAIAEGSVNTLGLITQPNTNNTTPLPDTSYITSWFEGQKQTSVANDILAQRVTQVIVGSTSKQGLGDVTNLLYTTDGGTTSFSTGLSVSPNALYCSIVLATPGNNTTIIDGTATIDITVPSGTTLSSISDDELFLGNKNIIMIPTLGLISFGVATVTGTNTYRLTRVLWNIGQSLWDFNKVQTTYTGFCYLMTSNFFSVPVPNTVALGATLRYFVEQPDGTLQPNLGVSINRPVDIFEGLSDYPRHVTSVVTTREDITNNLLVSWTPPTTQSEFQPGPIFTIPNTDAVSYDVVARNATTDVVLATHTGLTSLTDSFTPAELSNQSPVSITIKSRNAAGSAMPDDNLLRWSAV
jgi:hypothetical protein